MTIVTGSTTAIITPFRNGKLDEQKYAQLIQRQIDNGINAICPVGTTGESATLTHDEHNIMDMVDVRYVLMLRCPIKNIDIPAGKLR